MIIKLIVDILKLVKNFIKFVIKGIKEFILAVKEARGLYSSNTRVERGVKIRRSSHKDINNEIF